MWAIWVYLTLAPAMGFPVDSSINRPLIPGAEINFELQLLTNNINGANKVIVSCLGSSFMSISDERMIQQKIR